MPLIRLVTQLCVALLLSLTVFNAHAATAAADTPDPLIPYYSWYEVVLPESTGASCGNGTPMRFYINRAQSDNMLIGFEPGGACWDYGSCSVEKTGEDKFLSASNPDGIPHNYMDSTSSYLLGATVISPLMTRMSWRMWLFGEPAVETQNWTQVYLPYCTGDISTGNAIKSYTGPGNMWRTQHFVGMKNTQAVMEWLASHGFVKPQRLLVWGMSAGGYGALTNYSTIRDALQPQASSSLLDDSGTVFVTSFNADPATHPSVWFYDHVKQQWNWGGTDGILARLHTALGDVFDTNKVGSIYRALSEKYPHDRLGYTSFQQDEIISAFHYYLFDPTVDALPDKSSKLSASVALFNKELPGIKTELNELTNFGYYIPWARGDFIDSHMVTFYTFGGTGISENGIDANVGDFVNNLLNQKDPLDTPVMKAFRTDQSSDYSFNWFYGVFLNLVGLNPI